MVGGLLQAHLAHLGAGEQRRVDVDRVRRRRHQGAVTGAEQHPHEVRQPLLGPDGRHHLGLGVELDAEAAQVQRGDGLAELGDALARRVAVVLGVVDGLGELLDRGVGRGQVGVPEPEVDDVAAGSTGRQLQRLDVREDVRGQAVDPSELHRERLVPVRPRPSARARRRAREASTLRRRARRRPPRPRPRWTRATRTPPTSRRRRPPPPTTARSAGTSPATGPAHVTSQRGCRAATAAGWPSHRLTAAPSSTASSTVAARAAPHPHRHARARAGGRGARRAAPADASSAGPKGMPKARFSAALLLSPVPSPAMSRPGAMWCSDSSSATRTASGTSPTRATSGPEADTRRWTAATAPSTGKADSAGRSGAPMGHRWSNTNTPSRPSSSARSGRRRWHERVVAERRERDPDPHYPASPRSGQLRAALRPRRPGSGRRPGPPARRRWPRPAHRAGRARSPPRAGSGRPPADRRSRRRTLSSDEGDGLDQPTAVHHDGGVEDERQVGEPEGQPPPELAQHGQGRGSPALAAIVTCSPRTDSASPPARRHHLVETPGMGRLPGQSPEAAPRGEALPAPPLAARTRRPGRVDHHVADLAGEARRPPHDVPAGDDTAPDAGAERDHDGVGDARRRRRRPTPPPWRRWRRCRRRCACPQAGRQAAGDVEARAAAAGWGRSAGPRCCRRGRARPRPPTPPSTSTAARSCSVTEASASITSSKPSAWSVGADRHGAAERRTPGRAPGPRPAPRPRRRRPGRAPWCPPCRSRSSPAPASRPPVPSVVHGGIGGGAALTS